jgi:tRNA-5-taurinomethyluridine 2-sulfurtransferase
MNAVYVSKQYFSDDKKRNSFVCNSFNWIEGKPPGEVSEDALNVRGPQAGETTGGALHVKVRHGPALYCCLRFKLLEGGNSAFVQLPENDQGLAAGQFAVFYRDGVCLGSGVIAES